MITILTKYQELIEQTAVYPREIGIAYCALGLAGEAGEVANKVKKMYRDDDMLAAKIAGDVTDDTTPYNYIISQKRDDLKAELGDIMWYLTALAQELDLTLEDIMEYNMHKLLGRRERGTLSGSGDNR